MVGTEIFLTYQINVYGTVQGVGFRPTVYNLAKKQNLKGFVLNDSEGVKIHLQCNQEKLDEFITTLKLEKPPRSIIQNIKIQKYQSTEKFIDFQIKFSDASKSVITQISPDLDVCNDCLAELFDKNNPRYLYPFINCTNCGPRFTITQNIPYDRKNTTMSKFQMCPSCQSEYDNPENRRFHAQPNGCHHCGPELQLMDNFGNKIIEPVTLSSSKSDLRRPGSSGDLSPSMNSKRQVCVQSQVELIFKNIVGYLKSEKIIAIKGIGGFHLVCDAGNEIAVQTLRKRKYREDKPFAVMFANIDDIAKNCEVLEFEKELLEDYKHPIVLLKKKQNIQIADSTAPGNHFLGCMLPYSPVHHILMRFYQKPLIMTSGNISDEPVKYSNESALKNLVQIADYFLLNNREINIRCDDSVVRSYKDQEYLIRRSRGYVPMDLNLGIEFKRSILACGAEQKNVFGLAKNDKIYLSHHIGDLKNYEVLQAFESGVKHFENIFEIEPEIVVVDMHPNYLSTQFGKDCGKKVVEVQHHHAHAASCMAENGLDEKVIAMVLDGTGYGNEGNIWGGECLVCNYQTMERVGHFREVKMPGGDNAIKNVTAMGLSYLFEIFGKSLVDLPLPIIKNCQNLDLTIQMLDKNINSPITTSCGRLFDGVAAICGFRTKVNYEGQAAIEFEQQIENFSGEYYDFDIVKSDGKYIIDWEIMIKQLIKDVEWHVDYSRMSEKFHQGLIECFVKLMNQVRKQTGLDKVVLSGGVFMNMFLLKNLENKLLNHNFKVYTHHKVPTNDGGIALGQLIIANHKVV